MLTKRVKCVFAALILAGLACANLETAAVAARPSAVKSAIRKTAARRHHRHHHHHHRIRGNAFNF